MAPFDASGSYAVSIGAPPSGRFPAHRHLIFLSVFHQPAPDPLASADGSLNQSQIVFARLPFLQQTAYLLRRPQRLRSDHKTAGVAVQAVADSGSKSSQAFPGPPVRRPADIPPDTRSGKHLPAPLSEDSIPAGLLTISTCRSS